MFGVGSSIMLSIYAYNNVETVPITGRKRINWLPKILEHSFVAGIDALHLEAVRGSCLPIDHKV